jgi:tRNA(His) guanylyltransferase
MATLADRMKGYEQDFALDQNQPAVCRIDGHRFSKWTRTFEKPFDAKLHEVFVSTSIDLLGKFHEATAVYTQSDEMTIVFPYGVTTFGGRTQKLSSIAASFAGVRFNHHLARVCGPERAGSAHFDARFFNVPNKDELLNNVLWRAKIDCARNSKGAFARSFSSASDLHGMTADEQIAKIRVEHGVCYEVAVPTWARFGTTVRRERHQIVGTNPMTGMQVPTMRYRVVSQDTCFDAFTPKNLELIVGPSITDPVVRVRSPPLVV